MTPTPPRYDQVWDASRDAADPQIVALRRSLRTTKIFAALAFVAAVLPWLTWAQRPDPVDDELVLSDRDGVPRIILSARGPSPSISLRGKRGTERARFALRGDAGHLVLGHYVEGANRVDEVSLGAYPAALTLDAGAAHTTVRAAPDLPPFAASGYGNVLEGAVLPGGGE